MTWGPSAIPVFLQIGSDVYEVDWLSGLLQSVRPYFQDGAYLYGEVLHVLAHDTTATGIFALTV